jgi:predicted aspartyl protease
MGRLCWLIACVAFALGSARAQPPEPAVQPPAEETIGLDGEVRMTVPISIGGRPYRFLIDTGSERTVISRQIADRHGLAPGATVTVHSLTEVSRIATAIVPSLQVGRRTVIGIQAPTIEEDLIGADGLLGVDSLVSQRVVLDFRTNEMRVVASRPGRDREQRWTGDTIVVTARTRFGHLILVDAAIDGQRIWVIVDTGAEVSIGNLALRRRLERRNRLGPTVPIEVASVTGGRRTLDYGTAHRLRIGGAQIANLPVGFADVAPFRKLDLIDRPALLLGMDALRLFDRVSLDFATREVRLDMPPATPRSPDPRLPGSGS